MQLLLLGKSNKLYSECVLVALGIKLEMRMCHIDFWSLPSSIVFFHVIWQATRLWNLKFCVSNFSTNFAWNIFYSKKTWARYYHKCVFSSCKVPAILVNFGWKLTFLERFEKNNQISNFMKIHSVGASFSVQKDKANSRFSSKNGITAESISLNLFWLKGMKNVHPHFLQIISELVYKFNWTISLTT